MTQCDYDTILSLSITILPELLWTNLRFFHSITTINRRHLKLPCSPTTICLLWQFSKATLLQQRARQSAEQINMCYPKAKWRVPWVIWFLASKAHNISSIDLHYWKTGPIPAPTDADYYSRWLDVSSAWLLGLTRLNYAEATQSDIFKLHSRWKQIVFRVTSRAYYFSSCCHPLTRRVTGRITAVLSFVVGNDQ